MRSIVKCCLDLPTTLDQHLQRSNGADLVFPGRYFDQCINVGLKWPELLPALSRARFEASMSRELANSVVSVAGLDSVSFINMQSDEVNG